MLPLYILLYYGPHALSNYRNFVLISQVGIETIAAYRKTLWRYCTTALLFHLNVVFG